jgi:hypothetical protein
VLKYIGEWDSADSIGLFGDGFGGAVDSGEGGFCRCGVLSA